MGGVVAELAEHAFEHLFIECLGWDRLRATTAVTRHDASPQTARPCSPLMTRNPLALKYLERLCIA